MDWSKVKHSVQRLLLSQQGLATAFTWRGRAYTGVPTLLRREQVATDAGLAGDYSWSLLCHYDQFADALPEPRQDKVTVDGREYRILAVEWDAPRTTVKLHLGDAYA